MDFEFTQDQKLIGDQARTFLQNECSSGVVRGVLDGDADYDEDLWNGIAEMGWLGIAIPEEYGGLGLNYLELAVIAEEMGRSLAPVPFSTSVYLATELLLLAGSEEQKQRWLPRLASGEAIGTVALETNLSAGQSTTVENGANVTGRKMLVPDANIADFCVVLATEADGASLCLVELDQDAVQRTPATAIDLLRSVADVEFTQAGAERLGAAGEGAEILETLCLRAAVLYAWEQVGGSDAALEQARDYALERFAFGRPIASFQAIKHKLAQAYVKNTLARSNCYFAISCLNSNSSELALAAATARISAIQAYYYSSRENIQTHGGMGFTWEFDCHLHYRRAKSLSMAIGGETSWKQRLIATLGQQVN